MITMMTKTPDHPDARWAINFLMLILNAKKTTGLNKMATIEALRGQHLLTK